MKKKPMGIASLILVLIALIALLVVPIVVAQPASDPEATMDFGDAPDPLTATSGEYPTLLANDGPRHTIVQGIHLGTGVDAETDGQPTANANGDDTDGNDDDDGVTFTTPLVPGQMATVVVDGGPSGGMLDAWIDFHQDGSFAEFSDDIFVSETLNPGPNTLEFEVVLSADPGNTYARFRLSSQGGLGPDGEASDGEVEDYVVEIEDITPSITIFVTGAYPADGTDFDFTGDLGNFTLDSMNSNDNDSVDYWITFSQLSPQNYSINQLLPPGWTVYSGGVSGDSDSGTDMSNWRDGTIIIDLDDGENILFQYINVKMGTIGDLVWEDINGDGIQDSGEPGIEGVAVNLFDCTHGLIDTTTTDSNGMYSFAGLVPTNYGDWDNDRRITGEYRVEFVLPAGYTFTGQDQGDDDTLDSDADTSTGRTDCVSLVEGQTNVTLDAGLIDLCPDADGDGVCNDADQCPGHDDAADADDDSIPDDCDACPNDADNDADGDGVCGDADRCPGFDDNVDVNQNGIPDGCDVVGCADGDQDGVCDVDDNCPAVANPGQEDADDDGIGDVCDDCLDVDQDTVCDDVDNCVGTYNPDQKDSDADGLGNECDPSPYDEEECDNDGIPDSEDNCPCVYNPDQADADGDNIGDVCESTAPVPELPTVLLMGLGLAALGGFVWFRRQRQAITIA